MLYSKSRASSNGSLLVILGGRQYLAITVESFQWTRNFNLFVLYGRVRQAVNGLFCVFLVVIRKCFGSYVGVAAVLLAKTKSM